MQVFFIFLFLFNETRREQLSTGVCFYGSPNRKRTKDHVPWVSSHDLQNRPCVAQLHVPEANFVHQDPKKTLKMLLAQDEKIDAS